MSECYCVCACVGLCVSVCVSAHLQENMPLGYFLQ